MIAHRLCRLFVLLSAGAGLVGCQATTVETRIEEPTSVVIQPIGLVPIQQLEAAANAIEPMGVRVGIARPIELPKSAYYAPRNRYRAEKLLEYLEIKRPNELVVGMTAVDISTTKEPYVDWGIFGLGSLSGPTCVVSTFRLKKNADEGKLRKRIAGVAVHEFGHVRGLDHCPDSKCIMVDANGSIKSVDANTAFCAKCVKKLAQPQPLGAQ